MVKTEYYLIGEPTCTAQFIDEIIRLQGDTKGKGYPFNKNGTGNQGYLFNLKKNLAKFFLQEMIKRDPSMAEKSYVKALLD